MPRDRDVAAFTERADGYEEGWRGRLHHEISDRTAQLALAQVPAPHRVLAPGGRLVLVGQFSPLYLPTLVGRRRDKARTRRRATRLLAQAGFGRRNGMSCTPSSSGRSRRRRDRSRPGRSGAQRTWRSLMPPVTPGTASGLADRAARRLAAIDPLLPAPAVPAGCGADLTVAGPDGSPAAAGSCEHWAGEPGSLDLTWGAARRFQLTPQLAGPDVAPALDELLARWRDHLAAVPEAAEEDTAAVMIWPARDTGGPRTLLRHGLAPRAVIAARTAGRRAATAVPVGPGVRIRPAGPPDLDEVVRLGLETVRYDAHFGTVIERPDTAAALREEAARVLAAADPWVWLAERDGTPTGLLYAERPELAGWIAPMVRAAPVAYLELMDVLPGERGHGVAAALAGQLHQVADESGVAVTLLHYEQVNPLSGPFWHQQGYRPLWTSWEARPARTLR